MDQDTFEKSTTSKPKYDFEELKAEHKAHIYAMIVGYFFCTVLFLGQHLMGNEYANSSEALALLCLLDTIWAFELCKVKPKRKKIYDYCNFKRFFISYGYGNMVME